MTQSSNSELEIIDALLRVINHKLRTPLSVISNELFCLQSEGEREELSRAERKVQEISLILSEAARLPVSLERSEDVNLAGLVPSANGAPAVVPGDKAKLERLFSALPELLKPYLSSELRTALEAGSGAYTIRLSGASDARAIKGEWFSASRFFAAQGAADSFLPLEIDCIVLSHGGRITLSFHESTASCLVTLPKGEL